MMKKIIFIVIAIAAAGLVYSFMLKDEPGQAKAESSAIKWMTMEEAVKANKSTKKKFFIDLYTDWCGWCKKMDQTTFADPAIAEYINDNFHPVKFNAEQREDFIFSNQTFKWQAGGRNGIHMFAYTLLDGQMGFPSYVYLTPTYERILISPGFKQVPHLSQELKFVSDDHYTTSSWENYQKGE